MSVTNEHYACDYPMSRKTGETWGIQTLSLSKKRALVITKKWDAPLLADFARSGRGTSHAIPMHLVRCHPIRET